MTWRPEPQPACGACGRPADVHPVYIALAGDHDWAPPREYGPVSSDRRTTPSAVPHPDGGVTMQWIDDIDPSPVEAPLPPIPESCYPPDAVDLPVHYANVGLIRRILNATNRKGSS